MATINSEVQRVLRLSVKSVSDNASKLSKAYAWSNFNHIFINQAMEFDQKALSMAKSGDTGTSEDGKMNLEDFDDF